LPYTIVVNSLSGPEDSTQIGDEIGIFDGSTPVGVIVVDRQTSGNKNSLTFDGVDDYVNLGDILNDLYQPVTFQISAKFNGNGGTLFSTDNCGVDNCNYNGYWVDISTTQISIAYGDGEWHGGGERRTGKANVNLSAGEWYSITAIVRGPQDMSIYLDGTSLEMNYQDGGSGGNVNFTTDPFRVGKRDNSYFDGSLDELRVWDIELDADQIQSNYNTQLNGDESGLVAYWNFNEGGGSTVNDLSEFGNNGTIYGATWSADVPFNPAPASTSLSGIAWQADPDNGLAGFTSGNPLSFRYFARRGGEAVIYEASHITLAGDGNFGTQPFSVVEVTSSAESLTVLPPPSLKFQ